MVVLALALSATACEEPAGPEISDGCIAVVRVDGVTYEHDGQAAEDFTPGDHYATVSGHKECQDTIDPNNRAEDYDNTLADGESNFLPVGTRLYRVPGYAGTERLAADHDHDGEWAIVSVLQPDSASAR